MKERISNDFCELLEDEVEKITKKGDISPSEMDNAYKAIKSVYYLTILDEMKEAKDDICPDCLKEIDRAIKQEISRLRTENKINIDDL